MGEERANGGNAPNRVRAPVDLTQQRAEATPPKGRR